MNAPPKIGYLGRTFGWTGSRHEWLLLGGFLAWVLVGFAIYSYSARLTTGETVLLFAVWLLSLGVVARDAIRNLFGPVFFYDIVRVGRRSLTFWLRWLYAVGIGAALVFMYSTWLEDKVNYSRNPNPVVGTNELSSFGTEFFHVFIIIQFLVVVLLTPVYVAGTICLEKERKTLEFLLATDLRNREIIFGKLASRVTNLLMYVLVGLPILAFIQLFGGVDPEQLVAAVVATIVTILGLSAVGIWMSTMLKKSRDAIMLTYLLFAAYLFLGTIAAILSNLAALPTGFWRTSVFLFGWDISVANGIGRIAQGSIVWQIIILEEGRRAGITSVMEQLGQYVAFWGVATVLLLTHAIVRLRSVALHQAYGSPAGTRSRKKKIVTVDGVEKVVVNEATRQHPEMGDNPVFWKEVFVDTRSRMTWLGKLVIGLIFLLVFGILGIIAYQSFIDPPYYAGFSFREQYHRFAEAVSMWLRVVTGSVATLMFFAAAIRGAGAISGEKDKDSWISLLSTPLSADEILMGKWWGCVLSVRRPFFFLIVVWSVGLALGAANPFMIAITAAAIALYVAGFSWIGLYCSMTARNTMTATVRAFFAALFVAGGFWLFYALCCLMPTRGGRDFESLSQLLGGVTPPFMAGWWPMNHVDRDEMGPFRYGSRGLGWGAPVFGFILWSGFAIFLMVACRLKFRKLTNREPQELTGFVLRPEPTVKKNRYE